MIFDGHYPLTVYLLVNDHKSLVGSLTDFLLELYDLLYPGINKGSLCYYQLLSLFSRLVEETRVHLPENDVIACSLHD